jgi:stage II sporulation protein D
VRYHSPPLGGEGVRTIQIVLLSWALLASQHVAVGALADSSSASSSASGAGATAGARGSAARMQTRETTVRVLLFEVERRVSVSVGGASREIVAVPGSRGKAAGVRADGGALARSWRGEGGDAPLRVRNLEVRGAIEVVPVGSERLAVINEVPLESYLQGTLGREMYGSWSSAALKAQAVASRTYALRHMRTRRGKAWDVRSGTLSQVYAGVAAESDSVRRAVHATRGEVLVHEGEPILAAFHSSSGGRTASSKEVWGGARPYLVSVEVENEWESPDTYWRTTVSRTTLGRAVAAVGRDVGPIRDAQVSERTGSGRVARVRVRGDRGQVTVSGRELRSALGETTLKSTLFNVNEFEDGFMFVGSGNGHGVGMSQWGARAMAQQGDNYQEILSRFYPGAALRSMLDTSLVSPIDVSARGALR